MRIPIEKLVNPLNIQHIGDAKSITAAKEILNAAEEYRDKLRSEIEEKPTKDDKDLRKDITYKLGMIKAFNLILDLPREANKFLEDISEGD
ncbi:MAG TPA: hypothetical protein VMW90_03010 [Acidobacteriota bacterium]|nr:hypothetical protein [Acidobacteriota bacterium]